MKATEIFMVKMATLLLLMSSTEAFLAPMGIHPLRQSILEYRNPPSLPKSPPPLYYQREASPFAIHNGTSAGNDVATTSSLERFQRQAAKEVSVKEECILEIHGNRYNLTAWANAHPGGPKVLQRFHNKNATRAFEAAHHSARAYAMLADFLIDEKNVNDRLSGVTTRSDSSPFFRRARHKLFTKEDPIGVHKYLGIFCLLNFIGRYRQMYFGDPACGLGRAGHGWFSICCLIPHAMLSLSSLIFQTVPKERVVGKPMIWQEFRVHNILFGLRSVISALATALAIKAGNTPVARKMAISVVGAAILGANYGADKATQKLRVVTVESTTATMPYWEGCSVDTQKRFKGFYAYCQFMATLACLAVSNPAWPLAVLIAIQLASLMLTLVRKGLLSARGYHYGYTTTLLMPWVVGFRHTVMNKSPEFLVMMALGYGMYQLRRRGVGKYAIWVPLIATRFFFGDAFINYSLW